MPTTRHLEFSDGSSHKFWKIELDGSSFTVTFGRIGTSGQAQNKEFASDAEARKAFDKLVSEKTKKGYTDVAGAAPATPSPAAAPAPAAKAPKATKAAKESSPTSAPSSAPSSTPAESVATPTVVPAPAPAVSADIDLSVTREFDLVPEDWRRATFRQLPPVERPAPAPFDKDACVQRLAKLRTSSYGWDLRWSDLKLPAVLSREEAHFWFVAMTDWSGRGTEAATLAEKMARRKLDDPPTIDEMQLQIGKSQRGLPDEAPRIIANLLGPDEYLELTFQARTHQRSAWNATILSNLMDGFQSFVLPYLTPAQRDALRKRVLQTWDKQKEPASDYEAFAPEFYLAACLGLHDDLYDVTSRWPDKRFHANDFVDHYQRPQDLLFGLASGEIIAAEWRRLNLRFREQRQVRAFVACTEDTALDCLAGSIVSETNKEKCEDLLQGLALVRSPLAAEPMLQCKLGSKTPSLARDWLDKNVGRGVAGLLDSAAGKGKLADAAIEYLRGVKQKGHAAVIAAALTGVARPEVATRVRADVLDYAAKSFVPLDDASTPEWLATELRTLAVKRKPLPSWAAAANLPPLVVGAERLNDEQAGLVLQLLAATPAGTKHPLFDALRTHVPKASRDEFAWKLFQSWQEDGFPSKEKWAMGAIGHLGDDACVLKLTPLIRVWPGESQHARAVFGLECLRAIGSSVALMHLSGIAQKLKFKGLKAKAEQFVSEIAKDRGLTRDELEDRVVPDCGLDENGRREFSFGPRSFSFVLGGDLKPMVRDEAGKLRPNLPDPGAKDDAAVAEASVAEWKLLKKQIKDVAAIQAGRLEQAMITGRRWSIDDFTTLLVRHPLMTNLAQKLIWAGFDAPGQRLTTFRVTEERDFADPNDDAVSLADAATVGVVHPLELSESERGQWGQVLGDYEVVAPFAQLGRPVYTLEPGEESAGDLKRFHGLKLVAPTLVFTLEKLNWIRGVAMDGGCFDEHSKQFPAASVTAVIGYEGVVGMAYIDPNELLTLNDVYFCSGLRAPSGFGWSPGGGKDVRLKLKDVPPIVLSEVLADLQVLKSKAK